MLIDDRMMYFGRDDGLICDCGAPTFLVDDQGGGLCSYECEACGDVFGVQYDSVDDGPDDPSEYDLDHYDDLLMADMAPLDYGADED